MEELNKNFEDQLMAKISVTERKSIKPFPHPKFMMYAIVGIYLSFVIVALASKAKKLDLSPWLDYLKITSETAAVFFNILLLGGLFYIIANVIHLVKSRKATYG